MCNGRDPHDGSRYHCFTHRGYQSQVCVNGKDVPVLPDNLSVSLNSELPYPPRRAGPMRVSVRYSDTDASNFYLQLYLLYLQAVA